MAVSNGHVSLLRSRTPLALPQYRAVFTSQHKHGCGLFTRVRADKCIMASIRRSKQAGVRRIDQAPTSQSPKVGSPGRAATPHSPAPTWPVFFSLVLLPMQRDHRSTYIFHTPRSGRDRVSTCRCRSNNTPHPSPGVLTFRRKFNNVQVPSLLAKIHSPEPSCLPSGGRSAPRQPAAPVPFILLQKAGNNPATTTGGGGIGRPSIDRRNPGTGHPGDTFPRGRSALDS